MVGGISVIGVMMMAVVVEIAIGAGATMPRATEVAEMMDHRVTMVEVRSCKSLWCGSPKHHYF